MAYLPKLKPAIGNQLGGMPERAAGVPARGEITFAIPGTYTWVVPEGVTSVSAVCVGGGSGGFVNSAGSQTGGAGGGLAWGNAFSVSAGSVLDIDVGEPGLASRVGLDNTDEEFANLSGGESSVRLAGSYLVRAGGGTVASDSLSAAGGAVIVGSGGAGGAGVLNSNGVSGGGAGGYSGVGGAGVGANSAGNAGAGGGGGSGGAFNDHGSNGGGVGLFGEGSNGDGGGSSTVLAGGGGGGSGGETARSLVLGSAEGQSVTLSGASFGGGGSAYDGVYDIANCGGHGAVRIIWGKGREFPSTDVGAS